MLKPDNFNLILMSQKFAHDSSCNHQEYWYKTRYGVEGRFYFAFVKHGNKMKILKSELVEESCSQRECVSTSVRAGGRVLFPARVCLYVGQSWWKSLVSSESV